MKQRLADYIADFLVYHGITECFSVVGGGAMYLNNALGHKIGMHSTYNHHEQACSMAAEAYARYTGNPAVVCVTTGPGATNAITGVVCAWQASLPMIVISGQVRYATSVYKSGLKLRSRGIQEFDIIGSVKNMTKYCELINSPSQIKKCLEKALYEATSGRPGPVWLDIPLDIQAAIIEIDELESYNSQNRFESIFDKSINEILFQIQRAKKPLILAGNGIRISGGHNDFVKLIEKIKIPVVTTLGSVDAFPTINDLYVGKCGTLGDEAGNYALKKCDLLISIGSRLPFSVTGFEYEHWAEHAYKIICDVDSEELKKDSSKANLKVCCDARIVIKSLLKILENKVVKEKNDWIQELSIRKQKSPLVFKRHFDDKKPNIYVFYKKMTELLPDESAILVSVGSARTVGSKVSVIKNSTRFITNSVTAAMGYDLPAAIGVCVARHNKKTILCTGEGSLQMNIQELQTLVHNKCNLTIFVLNNGGYHSIRLTQKTYFNGNYIGMGNESGDISFPDLEKISYAYGISYMRCSMATELDDCIAWAIDGNSLKVCELMLSTDYIIEPKEAQILKVEK